MAKPSPIGKKPRVRKSAPTVRERVEAAAAKREEVKPGRAKSAAKKIVQPLKKLRVGDRKAIKYATKALRPVGKVLSFLVPRYFINSWREVRQVTWPNRKETWRLTLAVFVFATVFGALVAGVDKGLDEIFKHVILK
ncbi:MAG TPA: preprotein translocase subunit SecE [Candidatus Saccharimonadales bacterium]|nr:preprotein translocase subunit SecE [Candidatus Saccharimonadales bacterium]